MESFKEITWKNNHGLVEIYGMSSDPQDAGYEREAPARIGIYVQSLGEAGSPMRTAGIPLSPRLAREIGTALLRWSEQIESRG